MRGDAPETRHEDEIKGSGIETGTVATSDETVVLSAANATFTALTTTPRKAGSGRFAARKDGAVGELVGAAKETTVDQKRLQCLKTQERAMDR